MNDSPGDPVELRVRRGSYLPFAALAVALPAAAVLVPGEGIIYFRGLLLLAGLLCVRTALMRWAYRVRMNEDGQPRLVLVNVNTLYEAPSIVPRGIDRWVERGEF